MNTGRVWKGYGCCRKPSPPHTHTTITEIGWRPG
jgi:hypothetical protein